MIVSEEERDLILDIYTKLEEAASNSLAIEDVFDNFDDYSINVEDIDEEYAEVEIEGYFFQLTCVDEFVSVEPEVKVINGKTRSMDSIYLYELQD